MGAGSPGGVPILDVASNIGGVPRETDQAGRQDVQELKSAQPGRVPIKQGHQEEGEHSGRDAEGHEEQDPTAAAGPDRRVHDRGTPEDGEEGSCQTKAQPIIVTESSQL